MKKLLSILGVIGLTATSTTTLISCEKPNNNENSGGNKPKPTPEKPQQPPENSNWKLVAITSGGRELQKKKDKWYFLIYGRNSIVKLNSKWDVLNLGGNIKFDNYDFPIKWVKVFYRWDGNGEPETPEIDKNTGKITDWKD